MKRRKILLVNPGLNSFMNPLRALLPRQKVYMAPLSLATVAALTPDDVAVRIWDEGVDGLITASTTFSEKYDLIGITGFENHIERVRVLTSALRSQGVPLVVGGPGVSASPELYRDLFDHLFIGEAEHTWPRFIEDWKAGRAQKEYRQIGLIDMAHSPQPRWDAVDIGSYFVGGVQTTRGCPFDCEFCDVIYIYGRQPRHKPIPQVLEEIVQLERRGAKGIFLCDDNFIGTPSYGKALLEELVPLNRSFREPLGFFTQISLNVAKDDDFLSLLAEANFVGVYIGVETPNVESLMETNKPQNYRTDIVSDIRKIQSYGIPIWAGMIVGFDHDDRTIFQRQFEFLQAAGVANPHVNVLKAMRGTKLWVRLHKEGRVLETRDVRPEGMTSLDAVTNIVPKRMSRIELLSGYRELVTRIRDWSHFETRMRTLILGIRYEKKRRRTPVPFSLRVKALKLLLFDMDRQARGTTLRLLRLARRIAPTHLGTVTRLIGVQYLITRKLPETLAAIDNQLEVEKRQGGFPRARAVFFIPEGFEQPYKEVFPELFQRARAELADESKVKVALYEATNDFLTRWGPTFDGFGEHHRQFLFELCDRAVANQKALGSASNPRDPREVEPYAEDSDAGGRAFAMRMRRLADDILKSVQQDLRELSA